MEQNLRVIYKEEFWYISAMVNTEKLNCDAKSAEIEQLLNERLKKLTEEDLGRIKWNKELMNRVIELGKNISIKCQWVPFIEYFPFNDENVGLYYNMCGYFQFDIDYFKDKPAERERITPAELQQIPGVALNLLKEFCDLYANQYLFLDRESPILIFVTSDTIKDDKNNSIEIEWTDDNVIKYKKLLGQWTEIYSGQWPDYTESLYTQRVENNLSNRLSELHFIRRNSGFIYMREENYKNFFNSYMKRSFLEPTAQVRAMQFALITINESLNSLFSMKDYMLIKTIEEKIENLRNTRGMIQTRMSLIYNELDYNRRQHYTSVLMHLITQFNLNGILERIHSKFDVIQDSMDVRYQRANRENQSRVERGMNYLNFLFGLGVIAEIVVGVLTDLSLSVIIFSTSVLVAIIVILVIVTKSVVAVEFGSKKKQIRKAVDAVIFDNKKENVVLIKRRYPPCKGQWAFPGGLVEKMDKSPKTAIIREVAEETGLTVKVEGEIGVYDDPERDPRGRVVSTAYICSIIGSEELRCSDESTEAEFHPLKDLKGVDLAFDHEFILEDAIKKFFKKSPWDSF